MIDHTDFYTEAERQRLSEGRESLLSLAGDALTLHDAELLDQYIRRAVDTGKIQRDAFGLNPVVTDLETSLVLAEEIGPTRGALLGVLLNICVLSGSCKREEIARDFGPDVTHILHGLLRIRELYSKSAAVESENFRSLLVTFA